jgi:cytochrome c biogenesis protein CcmG/thiol:disulfide interchange protein DsbE
MKTKTTLAIILILFMASTVMGQKFKAKTAPDFTLPDINGKKVTLSDNYGEGPIYIAFWATWCKPCREELKIMQEVYEKYEDKGFKMFAINTEGPKAMGKIKSFVKSNGWTFDVLIDADGEVFRRKYKGFAMPFTVMTDSEGKVIFSTVGFRPGDEVHVEELLQEQYNRGTE